MLGAASERVPRLFVTLFTERLPGAPPAVLRARPGRGRSPTHRATGRGHRSLGSHKAEEARARAASLPKLSYVKSMDIT